MKTTLWEHQRQALDFATPLRSAGLFLSMGTGKTLVTLALVERRNHRRVLVVSPKSVMPVWAHEHAKHLADDRRVVVLDEGSTTVKAGVLEEVRRAERSLVVTNYDSFWRGDLARAIVARPWDLLVLDEAHRLKAPGGRASRFAAKVPALHRLALTGTPMPHSPLDIYAVYRTLDRSIFGPSFTLFRARYAVMGGYQNHEVIRYANLEELNRKVYSISFRVGKEVLDLPEENHVERCFELSPRACACYRSLEEEFVALLERGVVTASNALVKLLKLQQITSGFVRMDQEGGSVHEETIDRGKSALLRDILEDLAPEEPVVVFSRFHWDLDTVHEAAEAAGRKSAELSGRVNDLADWQRGSASVLAVQIQAGGVGVDLTRAAYSVFYSLGFSLGDYEQALARLHRPGQTRSVTHLHLVAEGTVDEKVYQALRRKKDVIEEVLKDLKERRVDGRREAQAVR